MLKRKSGMLCTILLFMAVTTLLFAGGQGEAKKEVLQIWISATYVDAQNNWLKAKAEAWAKEKDVEINLSIFPQEIYQDKFVVSLDAGNYPDIILQGGGGHILPAELGLVVPLDDVVDKIGRDDFYEYILESSKATDLKTGKKNIYGIPLGIEMVPVEVRIDLLEKAGMEIPSKPDYEWLFKAARAMNNPPNTYGLGITLSRSYDGYDNVMALIYSFGGGLMTDKGPHGGDIFNSEPTWKAFDTLKALYKEGVIPPDSVGWTGYDNNVAFMEGRVATVINGLSIYYKMKEDGNPIAKVTKEVPLIGAQIADTGGKSCFIMKSNPAKETLGKDLIYYILSDKEGYFQNMIAEAQLYFLPIFKSQGKIVTQQWEAGKWPMFAIDPMTAALSVYNSPMISYPFGEANSVADKIFKSLILPENWVILFTRNANVKTVAQNIAESINKLIKDTYGKK